MQYNDQQKRKKRLTIVNNIKDWATRNTLITRCELGFVASSCSTNGIRLATSV
jgi:hypothetical protein